MLTATASYKRDLQACQRCKSLQIRCRPTPGAFERCLPCEKFGVKCSFDEFEFTSTPNETAERHVRPWGDLTRTATACSSVGSSNSWGQHSWTTTAPSSYSSNSESVPNLTRRAQNSPNTPPDSGFGSYADQYQSASPFNQCGDIHPQGRPNSHDVMADSGLNSTELSQPSSPLASLNGGYFPRRPSKRRAFDQDFGTYIYHLGGGEVESAANTCPKCFTPNALLRRRTLEAPPFCYACDPYVIRPTSLKKDLIKKRNRGSGSGDRLALPQLKTSDDPLEGKVHMRRNPNNSSFSSSEQKRPNTALSTHALITSCTQQCAAIVRRLEDLEEHDQGDMVGLMLPLSLSVIKLRLQLWGQIAVAPVDDLTERRFDADHPWSLTKINGVICELAIVVTQLLKDTQDEVREVLPPGVTTNSIGGQESRLLKSESVYHSLLALLGHGIKLYVVWRKTTQWALVADLLTHQSLDLISQGLRARVGGDVGNLFTLSLGVEVPRNLSSMFSLLDNEGGTSAPMSYENGLLDPNDLVDQGRFDPGIRVYIQNSSNGSPEKGLISVDIVACNGGETPKQAMDSQSALGLQKRLQLHKPDEFRVLALAGYLENTAMRQVEILYQVPEWALPPYAPVSLFRLAAEGQLPTCMITCVTIARKLACAVLHFHACDWIHGNITDRNIIFFTERGTQTGPNLFEPFFCNFAPYPVREVAKCGASRLNEESCRERGHDIYQLAWVILKLVLGDDIVRQLRNFEFSLASSATEFENIINRSALGLLKNMKAVSLFKEAIMSCISGSAALEGIIEADEEFSKLSGFYWRVVRLLDHCLLLLLEDMPVIERSALGFEKSKCLTDSKPLDHDQRHSQSREKSQTPFMQDITEVIPPKDNKFTTTPADQDLYRDLARRVAEAQPLGRSSRPEVHTSMSGLESTYLGQTPFEEETKQFVDISHPEAHTAPSNLASRYRNLGEQAKAERSEKAILEVEETSKAYQAAENREVHMLERVKEGDYKEDEQERWSNQPKPTGFGFSGIHRVWDPSYKQAQYKTEASGVSAGDELVTYITAGVAPLFDSKQPSKPSESSSNHTPKHSISASPITLARQQEVIADHTLNLVPDTMVLMNSEEKSSINPTQAPEVLIEVLNSMNAADERAASTISKVKADTDFQGRKKVYPVQAAPSTIELWQQKLLPRLEKILEHHLPKKESASIDLLGIGASRESSRPTIVVTCDSVRQVKVQLRKRFVYDENIFDLKIRKGSVRRSTGRRAREKRNAIRRSTGSFIQDCPNRAYQQKPLSGASIGACLDGRPLPPGTYGGLILVDGQPYGMTVHHLLDPESEGEEEEEETDDEDASEMLRYENVQEMYDDISRDLDSGGSSRFAPSTSNTDVDSMPVYWDDSDESSGEEKELLDMLDIEGLDSMYSSITGDIEETFVDVEGVAGDIGDIPGFPKNHDKDIVITQPAQDDVLDPESFECGQSIGTYKLGTILASSGIRRVKIGSEKHEMDWALVQIEKQRLVARNIIRGGGKYLRRAGPPDLEPCAIVPMTELSELHVHATGRTSGLQGGMISQAMSSVRLHGRETFSKSWHVVGNLGIPGDSGSWVVDNDNGRICGHVLARCSIKRVSYIVPMELLLEDIKETLGARSVRLPSVATEVDQLLDEALAEYEMVDNNSNPHREIDRVICPGPDPSAGGGDDITPLAY